MLRGSRLWNVLLFLALVVVAAWWVARNWERIAAGGALLPASASVQGAGASARDRAPGAVAGAAATAGAAAGLAASAGADGTPLAPSPAAPTGSARARTAARTAGPRAAAGTGTPTASAAAYFAAAHLQRDAAESRERARLQAVADDPSASAAVRAEAEQELLQLDALEREEASAELVLQAKGFPESLVVLSPGNAVVVVEAARFGPAQAAEVAQAVAAVAQLDPDQIQIVARR